MIKKKLVRDSIPDIIEQNGEKPVFYIADPSEYKRRLIEKLSEEVMEFLESEHPEELADIMEVVYALAEIQGIPSEQLEMIRSEKAKKRGTFSKRIVLEQ